MGSQIFGRKCVLIYHCLDKLGLSSRMNSGCHVFDCLRLELGYRADLHKLGTRVFCSHSLKVQKKMHTSMCTQNPLGHLSRITRKPTMQCPNRSDTNPAEPAQKMTRGSNFWIWKVEELYYPSSESKSAISFSGTMKLVCAFVFAYADCWFFMMQPIFV